MPVVHKAGMYFLLRCSQCLLQLVCSTNMLSFPNDMLPICCGRQRNSAAAHLEQHKECVDEHPAAREQQQASV
jgi:hypothetical protein